jgi:hypothetical protein
MADPAPANSHTPSPAPASPAPAPGSLTGTRYDAPISDQAFDRLGPQDQSRFMRVRTEAGSEWVPRSDLQPSPAPEPSAAPAPGDTPPGPAAVWPVKKPRVVAARGLANGEFVISELKFHRSRRQCCAPCSARRSSAQRLW